jgi:hypothetical protein
MRHNESQLGLSQTNCKRNPSRASYTKVPYIFLGISLFVPLFRLDHPLCFAEGGKLGAIIRGYQQVY